MAESEAPTQQDAESGFVGSGSMFVAGSGEVMRPKRKRTEAELKQLAYVERYAKTAREESAKFGFPASIALAQGILESGSGGSKMARTINNHFGMKCMSRRCHKGHCANFSDDTHKDFFLKFPSAWASWRAHSKLITSGRYAGIKGGYKTWARELKKRKYATKPSYAEDLIGLIENLELYKYDL